MFLTGQLLRFASGGVGYPQSEFWRIVGAEVFTRYLPFLFAQPTLSKHWQVKFVISTEKKL